MKQTIPLTSTLSTDSHSNDIKNPQRDRDLFNKNQSYLYNSYLTNPRKTVIDEDGYITTKGDLLTTESNGEKVFIKHNGTVIADVLSLGVENTSFLDRDDAVIDEGFLWTVQKTLAGYNIEQIDLQTQEVTSTAGGTGNEVDVRFIRNTHKVITRNSDGSVTIDGVNYTDPDMARYLVSFNGEFTAAEVNGKIYFGYNNPSGVEAEAPTEVININIFANTYGWQLSSYMNSNGLDQNKGYIFNIFVADNVQIRGTSVLEMLLRQTTYAMDLLAGIQNPQLHQINLHLGQGSIITGRGGGGGNISYIENVPTALDGSNGLHAINCGSELNITGTGTIQGGGGGGGAAVIEYFNNGHLLAGSACSGGGGAGLPVGSAGTNSYPYYAFLGDPGTLNQGGNGRSFNYNNVFTINSGRGGNPGTSGSLSSLTYTSNPAYNIRISQSSGGNAGNAIRILIGVKCTIAGTVTRIGAIVSV